MAFTEEKRLWIGNLDPRVNEYQLLKLLQRHGKIEKFDLLFHKTGALSGQPRGYAFVTYSHPREAERAKLMHNMLLGCKRMIVTWAHSIPNDVHDEPKKSDVNIPALAMCKSERNLNDREYQIQAIEAKLKLMDSQSSKELEINKSVAHERSVIAMYQQNQNKAPTTGITQSSGGSYRRHYDRDRTRDRDRDRDRRPYTRYKKR